MSGLPVQTEKVLDRVIKGTISKAEASRRLGVSRKTIYRWLQEYRKIKERLASDRNRRKNNKSRLSKEIIKVVVSNPNFGPSRITSELAKRGLSTSNRSVWLALKKRGLGTKEHREDYAYNFRKSSQAQDPNFPGHLRLQAQVRKRMVEEVVLSGRKVSEVIKEYGISRKTYAKWSKRYHKATIDNKNIVLALSDQHPEGKYHPNGSDERTEKAVLAKVISNPELSSVKIAEKLGFVGNHGVQNILNRNNLNKYELRLSYSKTHQIVPKPIFTRLLNRIRLVLEQFIPSLAPAPPPFDSRRSLRTFGPRLLRTFVIASVFTLASIYTFFIWLEFILSQTPEAAIGILFASVALFMGSLFFLYSLKYYVTLAIVLSFSQQDLRTSSTSRSKGGFVSWLLGIANGKGGKEVGKTEKSIGLTPNLEHIILKRQPFVSVHIPLFNEKKVVERAIKAASNFEYPEYEVILADDSTDETTQIIRNYMKKASGPKRLKTRRGEGWKLTQVEVRPGVILKHLHRTSRSGYKGGALKLALRVFKV